MRRDIFAITFGGALLAFCAMMIFLHNGDLALISGLLGAALLAGGLWSWIAGRRVPYASQARGFPVENRDSNE